MTFPDVINFVLLTFAACVLSCSLIQIIYLRREKLMYKDWHEESEIRISFLIDAIRKLNKKG